MWKIIIQCKISECTNGFITKGEYYAIFQTALLKGKTFETSNNINPTKLNKLDRYAPDRSFFVIKNDKGNNFTNFNN